MVGYITTAHDIAQRLSEKWRHFVVHCLYSLFCTSPRCVGVPVFWRHLPEFLVLMLGLFWQRQAWSRAGWRSQAAAGQLSTETDP